MENLLNKYKILNKINNFINSYYYLIIIGLFAILSNILSLELYYFAFLALSGMWIFSFNEDVRSAIPLIIVLTMGISTKNSLLERGERVGIFSSPIFYGAVIITAFIFIGIIIYNFIHYKKWQKKYHKVYIGVIPLIFMIFTWMFSGIGSIYWRINSIYFCTLQLLQVIALSILMACISTNNKKDNIKYLAYSTITAGIITLVELFYLIGNFYLENGVMIAKYQIRMGWAVQNFLATYFVFPIPFLYYIFVTTKKDYEKLIMIGLGILMCFGCVITGSRSNLLTLGFIAVIIFVHWLTSYKHSLKTYSFIVLGCLLGLTYVKYTINVPHSPIYEILQFGFNLNGREALNNFAHQPTIASPTYPLPGAPVEEGTRVYNYFFGLGWFSYDLAHVEGVYPIDNFAINPRLLAHNIYNEIVCITGIIGTIGFIVFMGSIIYYVIKDYQKEKLLFLLLFASLIVDTIFDNFFFNVEYQRQYVIWLIFLISMTGNNKDLIEGLNNLKQSTLF